jgi:hypothetical protein
MVYCTPELLNVEGNGQVFTFTSSVVLYGVCVRREQGGGVYAVCLRIQCRRETTAAGAMAGCMWAALCCELSVSDGPWMRCTGDCRYTRSSVSDGPCMRCAGDCRYTRWSVSDGPCMRCTGDSRYTRWLRSCESPRILKTRKTWNVNHRKLAPEFFDAELIICITFPDKTRES